jgi:hypothetical protein
MRVGIVAAVLLLGCAQEKPPTPPGAECKAMQIEYEALCKQVPDKDWCGGDGAERRVVEHYASQPETPQNEAECKVRKERYAKARNPTP